MILCVLMNYILLTTPYMLSNFFTAGVLPELCLVFDNIQFI